MFRVLVSKVRLRVRMRVKARMRIGMIGSMLMKMGKREQARWIVFGPCRCLFFAEDGRGWPLGFCSRWAYFVGHVGDVHLICVGARTGGDSTIILDRRRGD